MLVWRSCGRNGGGWRTGARFERNSQSGKTFKYHFQCRRADILGGVALLELRP